MKYLFQLIFSLFSIAIFSQSNVNIVVFDTLYLSDKTNGALDSIEMKYQSSSMVFPHISKGNFGSFLNPFLVSSPAGSLYHNPSQENNTISFSALPHIGVAYVFGSQGVQHLTFNYHQVFRKNFVVNLSAQNNAATGFYRNSNWKNSAYALQLAKNSSIYSFQFSARFSKEFRGLCNGIVSDSLADLYALLLIPVRKEDANSNATLRSFRLENFIDFTPSDSLRFFGLVYEAKLNSLDRYYNESGQLNSVYPFSQYYSTITSDHYSMVDLANNVGVGYKSNRSRFMATLNSNYWRYTNGGSIRDTLELGLGLHVDFSVGNWKVSNVSSYNFIGAKNAWSVLSAATWTRNSHYLCVTNSNVNAAPLPFQRFYQANNSSYSLADFSLQKVYSIDALFRENFGKHSIALSYKWQSTKQVYVYDLQSWVNDANLSQQVINQFCINGKFVFGSYSLIPTYQFTTMDKDYRYYPMHTISARSMVKGGIFKAKKLRALAAVDLFYSSSYKAPAILTNITVVDFSGLPSAIVQKPLFNAAVLLGFEVETFRFFARLDNIAYFISDRSQLFFDGYTLPTWQIKLGVTWDFWN